MGEELDRDSIEDDKYQIPHVSKVAPKGTRKTYLAERYAKGPLRNQRFKFWATSFLVILALVVVTYSLISTSVIGGFFRSLVGGQTASLGYLEFFALPVLIISLFLMAYLVHNQSR
ncbi:MAG: hypothetical protein ABH950_00130 [Candidatus Altiarchaeota archaeon]